MSALHRGTFGFLRPIRFGSATVVALNTTRPASVTRISNEQIDSNQQAERPNQRSRQAPMMVFIMRAYSATRFLTLLGCIATAVMGAAAVRMFPGGDLPGVNQAGRADTQRRGTTSAAGEFVHEQARRGKIPPPRALITEVPMKAFEAVAAAVAAEGAEYVFGVMGDANQELIVELCEKHGLKFVHAHHEGSAVGMADGYARFSGKIGLAAVTQGPGYTNATTSLVSARIHRSPVLLLAGHASLRDPYNPQGEVDQHALAKLTTQATVKLEHAATVDYCLGEAFRQLKAKKGPFVLNLPQDIQQSALPESDWSYRPMYKEYILQPPKREDIDEAVRLLASARQPAILCGLGAALGKAETEVRELAEYLGAPLATSLLAAGFCSQYPFYMGISGGTRPQIDG